MHFLEMLKMKWLVWDTVDVLVDAIGVKLPFVPSPSQYSACSPLLSCGFNLWCKRSSFFSSSMFSHQVKGVSSEQWAIVEFLQRGFPPEIFQSEETPLPHHLWKCYLQKSMIPRNCSSMCIACAESIRRRLTSTCMVAKKAWGKGGGGQKAE